MTHGEWVISVITSIYVLISYLTLRAIRHSSRRQLRAYVLVENAGILDGTQTTPVQTARANAPGVAVVIKNSGQTPAYDVVSWLQIAVIPPANENTLVVPPLVRQFPTTVGSGGIFTKAYWYDRTLSAAEIGDIGTGARVIYLYGRIEYMDAFKKRHHSNFRLQWIGVFPPPLGSILNFSTSGNEAT